MFKLIWKEATARGRIVCRRKSFKSECDRDIFIEQLFEKLSFMEIVSIRDPLWARG